MPGYEFYPVRSELEEVVEAIWHADFPDAGAARSIVLPVVSPIVCFHFRTAPRLRLGAVGAERLVDPGRYRMTGVSSAAARIQADGAVGGVMVRLRPEGAARLRGVCVRDFAEAAFGLGDVFSPSDLSRLDERLLEAHAPMERIAVVERFLLERLTERAPDPLVVAAAGQLRRRPDMTIRNLAIRLGVSERHLSRCFRDALGASPKKFARIARIAAVVRRARTGAGWAETAVACGFADQAHMVNEFTAMVGVAPEALFRSTSLAMDRKTRAASRGESEFFNTFVAEPLMQT